MNIHTTHFKKAPLQASYALQVVELTAEAVRVFGSEKKAKSWLKTKLPILKDLTPQQAMESEAGQKQIALLLGQIDHGIFS